MSRPTQPKESLRITIRLADGETLKPAIIIPITMIGQIPAIIQADIYRHKADTFIENEDSDEQK